MLPKINSNWRTIATVRRIFCNFADFRAALLCGYHILKLIFYSPLSNHQNVDLTTNANVCSDGHFCVCIVRWIFNLLHYVFEVIVN